MTGRQRILDRVRGRATDCLPCMPITMMFASDLFGSRYLDYATDYRVQSAAQLKIAEEFELDHVSVISDPCCEASDCGGEIVYYENEPPAPEGENALLRDKETLGSLHAPDPGSGPRMSNRLRALRELAGAVGDCLLVEGWVEGPCAEAADLRGISRLMIDFYDDPDFVRELVEFVVEMGIAFARAQVDAGATVIGVGDAASSLIGPTFYDEFIAPAEQRLVDAVHQAGAICRLHICGNTRAILPSLAKLGCEIVDVDGMVAMEVARQTVGSEQVLLGNLDPVRAILNGTPETIRAGFAQCYQEAGSHYIVGAGCEIPRGTPLENFRAIVDYAHTTPGGRA